MFRSSMYGIRRYQFFHLKHVSKLPFISESDRNTSIAFGRDIIHFIINLCLLWPSSAA